MPSAKTSLTQQVVSSALTTNSAKRLLRRSSWQKLVKRAIDLLMGVIGSFITVLITPIIAALLKCEDGGPVFYASEFVDCDGQVRYYLKFRTMKLNADQILRSDPRLKQEFQRQYKLKNDPRVLRVGRILRKYSIDEFPQFFSLLTGRLTFVGPRTISRAEFSRYGSYVSKLLSVKPGMTGYWQVMGRQRTTYEERIQLDMYYIDHWSIWLDFVIIAKTFWKVPRADGAY
jgi:lipopolysaccharide/colanic/teichoic acid biosynthesis glycosyltransferase